MGDKLNIAFEVRNIGNTADISAISDDKGEAIGSEHYRRQEIVATNMTDVVPNGMLRATNHSLLEKRVWGGDKPVVVTEHATVMPLVKGASTSVGNPKGQEHIAVLQTYDDDGNEVVLWARFVRVRTAGQLPRTFDAEWVFQKFGRGETYEWSDGTKAGLYDEGCACEGGKCKT